jgi:hypothetical protein
MQRIVDKHRLHPRYLYVLRRPADPGPGCMCLALPVLTLG